MTNPNADGGNEEKIRVLLIAGNGRSGSTILNVILGQLRGWFTVGEVVYVWDRGVIENRLCGCGVPFLECRTWQTVFAEAFGGFDRIDPEKMVAVRDRYGLTKRIPGLMLRRGRGPRSSSDLDEYLRATGELYRAIRIVSGCEVIVDASKWPTYGYLVDQLPDIDLSVIHLMRDPRASAFSWMRVKQSEPGRYLLRLDPLRSTAYWMAWNSAIPYFWKRPGRKYMFLAYEELVAEPRRRLEEIVEFAAAGPLQLPFVGLRTVTLETTHGISGNVDRLKTGEVTLRMDDEWKRLLPWRHRVLVTALTWPWLVKYGYWKGRPAGGKSR